MPTKTKTKTKAFAPGDTVALKGQGYVLTVIPQPNGGISLDGWVWVAQAHDSGVAFNLLPIAALDRVA